MNEDDLDSVNRDEPIRRYLPILSDSNFIGDTLITIDNDSLDVSIGNKRYPDLSIGPLVLRKCSDPSINKYFSSNITCRKFSLTANHSILTASEYFQIRETTYKPLVLSNILCLDTFRVGTSPQDIDIMAKKIGDHTEYQIKSPLCTEYPGEAIEEIKKLSRINTFVLYKEWLSRLPYVEKEGGQCNLCIDRLVTQLYQLKEEHINIYKDKFFKLIESQKIEPYYGCTLFKTDVSEVIKFIENMMTRDYLSTINFPEMTPSAITKLNNKIYEEITLSLTKIYGVTDPDIG